MQFGDSDVENIGEERVNSLLGTSPDENRGKDREEVVKSELEDYDSFMQELLEKQKKAEKQMEKAAMELH